MESDSNQLSNWSRGQLLIDNVPSGYDRVNKAVEMLCKTCIAELWDEST